MFIKIVLYIHNFLNGQKPFKHPYKRNEFVGKSEMLNTLIRKLSPDRRPTGGVITVGEIQKQYLGFARTIAGALGNLPEGAYLDMERTNRRDNTTLYSTTEVVIPENLTWEDSSGAPKRRETIEYPSPLTDLGLNWNSRQLRFYKITISGRITNKGASNPPSDPNQEPRVQITELTIEFENGRLININWKPQGGKCPSNMPRCITVTARLSESWHQTITLPQTPNVPPEIELKRPPTRHGDIQIRVADLANLLYKLS